MSFEIRRRIIPRLVLRSATFAIFAILTASTVPSIHSFGGRLSYRTTTSIPVRIVVTADLDVEVAGFLESSSASHNLEVDVSLYGCSSSSDIVVEFDENWLTSDLV